MLTFPVSIVHYMAQHARSMYKRQLHFYTLAMSKWKFKISIRKNIYKNYSKRNARHFAENYKILLRRNEELRDMTCSLIGKINTIKMSVHLI